MLHLSRLWPCPEDIRLGRKGLPGDTLTYYQHWQITDVKGLWSVLFSFSFPSKYGKRQSYLGISHSTRKTSERKNNLKHRSQYLQASRNNFVSK